MIKKFISEFVGTLLLVFFGCGTAVAANKYVASVFGEGLSFNMLLIAFAFGLILMALVYTIGRVSGSHVNPAVSIACLIDGRISVLECVYYIIAQVVGGIAGAMLLSFIFASNASLGANGYGALSALGTTTTLQVALVIELILTFIFVLVVLATTKKENCFSGLAIGLTLTLVHIMGLPFTGTSVNPARSIGPAIITGGLALEQLWVFIVAPIVGGILAALFYKYVIATPETENISLATKTTTTVVVEDEEDEEEPVKEEKATTKKATTKKTTKSSKTDSKKTKKEN